jgi:hypothetical protein
MPPFCSGLKCVWARNQFGKYENYNEYGHPDSQALFGLIGTRKYPFSWPQYCFSCYLMTLSVTRLYSFDDWMINECGVVGGIRTEKWHREMSVNFYQSAITFQESANSNS